MIWLVMGVTGCGKTTLGKALAERLKIPFYDADDFHPPANREKLSRDEPLQDADRWPWLEKLAGLMPGWEASGGAVLACSALKESYRSILRRAGIPMRIVWLEITPERASERLGLRRHELVARYEKILAGQFRDLETPAHALTVSADLPLSAQVQQICPLDSLN